MSASSIRRVKERGGGGGGGGKVAAPRPAKSVTPISSKCGSASAGAIDALKKSTGKENPRPSSRVSGPSSSQKPVIRSMPRIDKPASGAACKEPESRARRPTPTLPRGRSSSPSDFSRMLSDLRKHKASRVSVDSSEKGLVRENGQLGLSGGKGLNGARVLEKFQQKKVQKDANAKVNEGAMSNGNGVPRKSKDSVGFPVNLIKSCEFRKGLVQEAKTERGEASVKIARVSDNCIEAKSRLGLENLGEGSWNRGRMCSKEGDELNPDGRALKGVVTADEDCKELFNVLPKPERTKEKPAGDVELLHENSVDKVKIFDGLKQKVLNDAGATLRISNNYPSKLHEKLSFLEGKVKRIASDIKKTKEMLDMNNTDESKVVLSDIQEKISGIEKAMGSVLGNSVGTEGPVRIKVYEEEHERSVEKSQGKPLENAGNSAKGMNSEELEARLFPHHKLLRNRTSLKASSDIQSRQPIFLVSGPESKVSDNSTSSLDENPISLEFLASLSNEKLKVSVRDGHAVSGFDEVQDTGDVTSSEQQDSSNMFNGKQDGEVALTTDETIDEFDDQENRHDMIIDEESEEVSTYQLNDIGCKTSTGGWFVSEGESVLLAHDDGSCTFYDIANCEGKAEYKPSADISPNVWRDCWIIRAPGADGCSGRYVVAASAGNTMDSGFCSWDFYTKDVQAFHIEDAAATSRTVLGPLPNNIGYRRNALSTMMFPVNQQWWYKPCGPLIVSTATCQRFVKVYDIRDGEQIMKWEVQKPVLSMDYSSPLQWRNRGKVVVSETDAITLYDVSSLNPQALLSIPSISRKISALHVNNTDAELGGGVRQRVSSSEAEGNDGVFCTSDSINIMDFRSPSGVGLRIPELGVNAQSVFARGDSIFLGCTSLTSTVKKQTCSQVQQFSMRKQKLVSTYALPDSNAHLHHAAITQVWGNSNFVMGVCGLGLFVFDATKDDVMQPFTVDSSNTQNVREVIGPDDMYSPSFDYSSARALVISRDRPAMWRHL